MAKITKNERSWAISLITDINLIIASKTLRIKRAGGETTINTGSKRMFPDVILYGDENQTQILQGWEIKMPDVPIGDRDFITDAQRKANILGLNSCFIWNFTCGVLYVKDDKGAFYQVKKWENTNYIKTREDVETYKKNWILLIESILLEINEFFVRGEFKSSGIGDIISDKAIWHLIERNKSLISEELIRIAITDSRMRSFLNLWWIEVQKEYLSDEPDMYCAYSKTIILNWINKIVFSHMIKSYHDPAKEIEKIDEKTTIIDAINIFTEITRKCDFYNIFKAFDYGECIPADTWADLVEFNVFLTGNGITRIEHQSLQNILENTVRSSKRAIIGQYTTPNILAELLVKLSVDNLNGNVLDPCCGTGTIPRAVLKCKRSSIAIQNAFETTWSSDKYSFPLQVSNISLTDAEAINIPIRIFKSNVFELKETQKIDITNPKTGEIMKLVLPGFDTIVSNLPFVDFNKNATGQTADIIKVVKQVREQTGIKMNMKCDLYAFIAISLWQILKYGGKLGIITSNSWLGTDAGKNFFDVLRWYYNIEGIYISGKGKWFDNAKVVAAITVLSKKEISATLNSKAIHFGIIYKKIQDFENSTVMDTIVNSIMLKQQLDREIIELKSYEQTIIDDFLKMNIAINAIFHNIGWILKIKDKLIPLKRFFKVFRGEKTGCDDIFYLKDTSKVDVQFIKRGLKTSKSIESLRGKSDIDVLCCDVPLEKLKELSYVKTYEYLNQFKDNLNTSLKQKKEKWHMLDTTKLPYLFTGMNPDERMFFGKFEQPTFINQRLIGLLAKKSNTDINLCHALLCSMLGMFYLEAIGFGRGDGVLDFSKDNVEEMFMLDPELLDQIQKVNILTAFRPLLNRPVLPARQELELEDKLYFEHTVLQAYGIDNYFDEIKASLISLQNVRLSVKKGRK